MRPLKVDFAPARRPIAALAVWGALCAVATIGLPRAHAQTWERRTDLAARAAEAAVPPAYARDALAVARTAAFPLQPVLRSLETVAVEGVRVSAIELNATRGGADVTLEFDDYKALLAYLELLNEGEATPRWSLVRAEAAAARRQAVIRSAWQ